MARNRIERIVISAEARRDWMTAALFAKLLARASHIRVARNCAAERP